MTNTATFHRIRARTTNISRGTDCARYVISSEIADAANVALALRQPLLVTGEPGCGKTTLAWAIAAQLGVPVHTFHTKSDSRSGDLFYSFDSLRRFSDANAGKIKESTSYISFRALGNAIRDEGSAVVLIDEIDKAPRDFPNDVLNELDQIEFTVHEVEPPKVYRTESPPFILITSNSERRLPRPFLRRCVYAHLEFPGSARLNEIVLAHFEGDIDELLRKSAISKFLQLREVGLTGPPATAELLGWVRVLKQLGVDAATLTASSLSRIPAKGVLIKSQEDLNRIEGM